MEPGHLGRTAGYNSSTAPPLSSHPRISECENESSVGRTGTPSGSLPFWKTHLFFFFCAVSDGDGETLCDGCVRLEFPDSDHALLERGLSCGRVQVLACYLCTAVCCIIIITFNAGRRPCEYFAPLAGYK